LLFGAGKIHVSGQIQKCKSSPKCAFYRFWFSASFLFILLSFLDFSYGGCFLGA
jgi:hypothetical protein